MIAKDARIKFTIELSGLQGCLEVSSCTNVEESSLWSLDALIYLIQSPALEKGNSPLCFHNETSSGLSIFLKSALQQLSSASLRSSLPLRFIFSSANGYTIRNDFLEQRLECSQHISSVSSFMKPLQRINGVSSHFDIENCSSLLNDAIGVLTLRHDTLIEDLDAELYNRLSFPWLSTVPIPPRRLAWVQGREDIDCIGRALQAAVALGIKIVVLDEPGHWLQDPNSPWASLREAFVEVDITADEDLATRVADAVRAYPRRIDGVITISDVRLAAIAKACGKLGLPTENSEAYDIAGDKGQTRLLESVGVNESFILPSASELEGYLGSRNMPLQFPVVVKPVIGWCSDCVSKVQNIEELAIAARKASHRHAHSAKPSTTVVVEPYIDGPEVDANFVLLDGEIVFCDINDDFPSPADEHDAGPRANFQETQNVLPSGLPQTELDAIREQLRNSILRQGFKSGVFHCEARVRNSKVEYRRGKHGLIDLCEREALVATESPEVYLHENNARPPGYLESVAVMLTYGVDYYALRMLLAFGQSEESRLRALSQPFLNGPQFNLSLMIIQQTRAGIMKTPDAARHFLEMYSGVKEHVVDYYTRKKGGDVLEGPDASALWWVAYFSVISRTSRQELLKRVEYIHQNFAYEVEEEV